MLYLLIVIAGNSITIIIIIRQKSPLTFLKVTQHELLNHLVKYVLCQVS